MKSRTFSILLLALAVGPLALAQEADPSSQDEMIDVNGRKHLLVPATPKAAPAALKSTDACLLKWDFAAPDFKLWDNGYMAGNGYKSTSSLWGQILPYPKAEGKSLTPVPRYSLVPSGLPDGGKALQYVLGPQERSDPKARTEHYLTIENFDKTYVSDFSLKLHPGFTPIDLKGETGRSAWCLLHQWHQGISISPPMVLRMKTGTRDVLLAGFSWGSYNGDKSGKISEAQSSEKKIQLGQWYHFRFEWRIAPGTDRSFCKVWMSDQRKGDELTAADLWCNYHGPIGYVNAEGNPVWISHPIREQQGLYQNSHFATNAFHAVIYDNISIHLRK
jgi:hypothetical protein